MGAAVLKPYIVEFPATASMSAQKNDGRVIQLKRFISDQKSLSRQFNDGYLCSFSGRKTSCGWEINGGILIHAVADFPWIARAGILFNISVMILEYSGRTSEDTSGKIAGVGTVSGIKSLPDKKGFQQILKIVFVGVVADAPGIRQLFLVIIRI